MPDSLSNSKKGRETSAPQKPKLESVVADAPTSLRKPSWFTRVSRTFLGSDPKTAAKNTMTDVVIPGARQMLFDAFVGAVSTALFGERRSVTRDRGGYSDAAPRIRYNNPNRETDPRYRDSTRYGTRDRGLNDWRREIRDPGDIPFQHRADAERVLARLIETTETFDAATVGDAFDLAGMASDHSQHQWGWTYLGEAAVVNTRAGYFLELPEPIALRN